jgi:hypothetical protein
MKNTSKAASEDWIFTLTTMKVTDNEPYVLAQKL